MQKDLTAIANRSFRPESHDTATIIEFLEALAAPEQFPNLRKNLWLSSPKEVPDMGGMTPDVADVLHGDVPFGLRLTRLTAVNPETQELSDLFVVELVQNKQLLVIGCNAIDIDLENQLKQKGVLYLQKDDEFTASVLNDALSDVVQSAFETSPQANDAAFIEKMGRHVQAAMIAATYLCAPEEEITYLTPYDEGPEKIRVMTFGEVLTKTPGARFDDVGKRVVSPLTL